MKKRILTVCKGHQNIAGAQLYLKQIASLFPRSRYELHYGLRKADGLKVFEEIAKDHNVNLWEYDWRHLPLRRSIKVGLKLFKGLRPHIVIFNSSEDKVLAPIWASALVQVKKRIMVVHWAQSASDLPIFRSKPGLPFPVPSRYSLKTRLIRGLTFRWLTKIIFVNNMTRDAYNKLYRVPDSRCVTIYNGVDLNVFSNLNGVRPRMREQLGVNAKDIVLFAAGNLTEVKGYGYLIKAIRLTRLVGAPMKCFIAGQGELKKELETLINDLDLNDKVELLGYRDDIPYLLAASDIFCMPSINEALGYSLLEAMAAGLPVIATDVGGIPEVVTNGKEGILVPPKDAESLAKAIEKLAVNPELRIQMGNLGRKTVEERFSVDKMLSDTAHVFEEIFV